MVSNAQDIDSLSITGDYQNSTLIDILSDIETNEPVRFFYKREWMPESPLNLTFKNESLINVLEEVTKPLGLNYLIYYNSIIIAPRELLNQEYTKDYFIIKNRQENLMRSNKWITASNIVNLGDSTNPSTASQVLIKGIVIDQLNSEPLTGVNLHFEALNYTASTDNSGRFELSLPTGYNLLEISYIGYETQKIVWRIFSEDEIKSITTSRCI